VYVCVCNAYRESHVRDAIQKSTESGAVTVEQVYARLGNGPRCGRCVLYVKDLINASREKPAPTNGS
jgi:bacterioferritin-associated ferredoxin